jgi:hypothetical protein
MKIAIEPIEDALHDGQLRVLREAGRFNVLECGRRFGKTHLGVQLAIDVAIDGGEVGWFAPTYRYLADPWRAVEKALGPAIMKVDRVEKRLDLISGGSIDFWSLDSVDAGRGRRYDRVIIDEAGIVRDLGPAWQETIRATLADKQGDAWFLGTPKGRNFFHRCFERGQIADGGWKSWRLPTTTNPTIRDEEIEAARRELPKQVFEQEFLGVPADDGGNPFGLDAIERCIAEKSSNPPKAIGVDLAKSVDYTVVCGLDEAGSVCLLERWQAPWSETIGRIERMLGEVPALIDSTGVGDPIVEDLQRKQPRVEGFKFTQVSKQQLMEGLASAFQTGRIQIPDGWLRTECETFEYQYTRTGVRYEAPSGMHDDGVCALALALRCLDTTARTGFDFRVL